MDVVAVADTDADTAAARAIPARIDRLPMSREIWRILFLAGIAWLVESYDIGIVGNVLPSLQQQYHLSTFDEGLVVIASTLGIVVAVVPSGWLADQIGRKKMLLLGTVWYAVCSALCGLAPGVPAIVVLRFLGGLGMGAIFPIPYAMAAELTPRQRRGAMAGMLDAFLSVGYFLAPLAAFALIPRLPAAVGWRFLFFLGGLPLLYAPVLFKWMPESPRWLAVKGRAGEADQIVSSLEAAVERRSGRRLSAPRLDLVPAPGSLGQSSLRSRLPFGRSVATILRPPYRRRTLMMWVSFACILFVFYAVQTYTPTVLVKEGYALGDAFLITAAIVIASLPGKAFEAYAVERYGRKATIVGFTVVAAASAVLFGVSHNPALALTFGVVLSFFGIGVDPAIKIYGAEQYPTPVRETGVGFTEGVGRLFGGALAPFLMAFILASVGVFGSYLFVAAVALVGALVVALFGTETKGVTLERASAVPAAPESHTGPHSLAARLPGTMAS